MMMRAGLKTRPRAFGLVALAACLGLLAACGDETEDDVDPPANNAPANNDPAPTGAVFTTYNIGLARGFVDFAEERAQPIADALAASDSDVLCLQEVWDDDFIELMIEAPKATYPHNFFQKTVSDEMVDGCTDEEIAPLEACANENCDGIEPGELAGCVLDACGEEFRATSAACQGCAAAQLGNPLEDIINNCRGGGDAFSYGGHNGLLMLSKHPLSNTSLVEMSSSLVFRSALHATIDHPELGAVNVYCTHLAADLSASIDYQGEFDSFEGEQAQEISELGEFIEDTQVDGRTVLMGDFNTGPAKAGCASELPDNYGKLLALGFESPYADLDAPACTFQENNTLVGGDGDGGQLLDHVFTDVPETDKISNVSRVFEGLVTIMTADGEQQVNLSDHFGVSVTIAPE